MAQIFNQRQQESLRDLVDLVRRNSVTINLPEICVVGATSAGKSSMLSSLTGIELPSANEICTRVPTCIRTQHSASPSCFTRIVWSQNHKGITKEKAKKYRESEYCETSGNGLVERIKELQESILDLDEVAGGVSASVIEIELNGPEHNGFTITDLPGVVGVTGEGESETIIDEIDRLIEEYMKNEMCIMLCVLPAEEDFHNHDILNRALKFDAHTSRTFPVLTKADRVEATSVQRIERSMANAATSTKFRRGFHLVKNRTQAEINAGVTIEESVESEEKWFRRDKESPYRDSTIDTKDIGIVELRKKISQFYMAHLSDNIPTVMKQLEDRCAAVGREIIKLGPDCSTDATRRIVLRRIIDKLCGCVERLPCDSKNVVDSPDYEDHHTVRSAIELLKRRFAQNLVPKEQGMLTGSIVEKRVGNEMMKCKVIRVRPCPTGGIGDRECALVPLFNREKFFLESEHRQELLDGRWRLNDTVKDVKGQQDGVYVIGGFVYVRSTSANNAQHWRRLKYFDEFSEDLHPVCKSLEKEIDSNRQRSMAIFEGESVFNHHVRKWLSTTVRSSMDELLGGIKHLLWENLESSVSVEAVPELDHHKGLRSRLQCALAPAFDEWFELLRARCARIIQEEWNPHTMNHYMTTTIVKMRRRKLYDEIVAGEDTNTKSVPTSHLKKMLLSCSDEGITSYVADEVGHALRAYFKIGVKNIIDTASKVIELSLMPPPRDLARYDLLSEGEHSNFTGKSSSLYEHIKLALDSGESEFVDYLQNGDVEERRQRLASEMLALKDANRALQKLKVLMS